MQLHGGYGYMWEYRSRARLPMRGCSGFTGDKREIMKEVISRSIGLTGRFKSSLVVPKLENCKSICDFRRSKTKFQHFPTRHLFATRVKGGESDRLGLVFPLREGVMDTSFRKSRHVRWFRGVMLVYRMD